MSAAHLTPHLASRRRFLQAGGDAGAEFHFAAQDGDVAVFTDRKP